MNQIPSCGAVPVAGLYSAATLRAGPPVESALLLASKAAEKTRRDAKSFGPTVREQNIRTCHQRTML